MVFQPRDCCLYPFGTQRKWALDAYVNSAFYTDNTSYRGREILRQEALPGFEGHISYSFLDSVVSLDARYSFRGDTYVNRVDQNDAQKNFILGSEVIVSLSARNTLSLIVVKALVTHNGP